MTKGKFFLSFVEEGIMNPKYYGYTGGRVEVYDEESDDPYAIDELRFFTNKLNDFNILRDAYDFKTLTKEGLEIFQETLETLYYDSI